MKFEEFLLLYKETLITILDPARVVDPVGCKSIGLMHNLPFGIKFHY